MKHYLREITEVNCGHLYRTADYCYTYHWSRSTTFSRRPALTLTETDRETDGSYQESKPELPIYLMVEM